MTADDAGTRCVNSDEAEQVYNTLTVQHPSDVGYLACDNDDGCDRCLPYIRRLDELVAECEARGCTEQQCIYDPPREIA